MRPLYKHGINEMSEKYIGFLSRECKGHLHERCHGKWCGLSFEIYCCCDCHKNKALAQVWGPETNAGGIIQSPEEVYSS
jgi:hypothetical protein